MKLVLDWPKMAWPMRSASCPDAVQERELDADDPRANYMLQAGARLCKALGSEFIPYLGVVMPSLLRSAQLKPDVNVAEAGSDEEDEEDDDEVQHQIPAFPIPLQP